MTAILGMLLVVGVLVAVISGIGSLIMPARRKTLGSVCIWSVAATLALTAAIVLL